MTERSILDMCCGSRMFWFDKADPRAVFTDIRNEEHTLCDGRKRHITQPLKSSRITAHFNNFGVNMALITLRQWGDRLPVPPSTETLRRWHRDCKIYPPSEYDGYRILVEETAVRINPRTGRKTTAPVTDSLTARIKHGRTEKKP